MNFEVGQIVRIKDDKSRDKYKIIRTLTKDYPIGNKMVMAVHKLLKLELNSPTAYYKNVLDNELELADIVAELKRLKNKK